MAGRWFDTATLVSFTNKTVRQGITEILSKVALSHNIVTVSILASRDHSQLKLVHCLIIYYINWNIHGIFWFLTPFMEHICCTCLINVHFCSTVQHILCCVFLCVPSFCVPYVASFSVLFFFNCPFSTL
jgi:hypothetical protein